MEIHRGDRIWLKGGNGSGKTSFANVVAGVTENYTGTIAYNGIDYREGNLAGGGGFQNRICMIGAKPELFHATVRENILLGRDADIPETMKAVLAAQGIDLDAVVEESGSNLSGGEAKIVQFFQGIINDADMYILDEPLNFIDEAHANSILGFMGDLLKEKTLLVISHDERVAGYCNRICIIEGASLSDALT